MHEAAIAENLIQILEEAVPAGGRLVEVGVQVGELAGVLPDCLRFAFVAVTEGTRFAGTSLKIETVPLTVRCRACSSRFRPLGQFRCPNCGSAKTEIERGRELNIAYFELEEDEDGQDNYGQKDTRSQ